MTEKEMMDGFKNLKRKGLKRANGYRLDYQGNGHEGNCPIGVGKEWNENVHCFSDICSDRCKMVVRPLSNGSAVLPERYWRKLMKCMRELNPELKGGLKATYAPYTCRFDSGNGYANYFAFLLWRLSVQQPKAIVLYLHIHSKGFDAVQSFMIMMALKESWYTPVYGGTLFEGDKVVVGIEKRLREMHKVPNKGSYTMRGEIIKYSIYGNTESLVQIIHKGPEREFNKRLYNSVYAMFSKVLTN